MIITRQFLRSFHWSPQNFSAAKSALAVLRKKTGYSIANCKKALQMHSNDLGAAEIWLKEQAQTLGWTKATKLEGRQTTQGLVGVVVDNSSAALVELNCETDFVAKNDQFKNMVKLTATTCLQYLKNHQSTNPNLTKIWFTDEQLKDLACQDGKKLSDVLALMIGTLGENATLKRALCYSSTDGIYLSGYAHPSGDKSDKVAFGKFGCIVALKQTVPKDVNLDDVGKELCQHIVGMNPQRIGSINEEPNKNKDEETSLIHQEYLLDEDVTVKEYLNECGIEVVDFKRFQCGENLPAEDRKSVV